MAKLGRVKHFSDAVHVEYKIINSAIKYFPSLKKQNKNMHVFWEVEVTGAVVLRQIKNKLGRERPLWQLRRVFLMTATIQLH